MTTGRRLLDAQQAAELFGIPAARIHEWKARHRITEADTIPGRGRKGRVPLFDVEELRPLVQAYRARIEAVRDTPEASR